MKILNSVTEFASKHMAKLGIGLAKNAPNIAFGLGIASVFGGTIVAITSSSKADAVMDEFNRNMDRLHNAIEEANATGAPEKFYPVEQQVEHKRVIYGHMIMSMAKIYIPVAALEILGIFLLCKSHRMLNKRNASLAAAYAALQKSFNTYRQRVRNRYGDEVENDIFMGKETYTITEKQTSDNGVTTEVETTKESYDPCSPFSFLITLEDNPWGYKDPYSILTAINDARRFMNNELENKRSFTGKAFMTMNEIAEYFNEPQRDEWSTYVVYQNNKDLDGAIKFNINPENIHEEGSIEWKFVNRIIDGLWITPNIQANLCDNLKTQYQMAGLDKARGKQNGKILLQ